MDHCLRAICEAAELEGIECEQAACAGGRQDASKKTLFNCLPKLLAFTIGRTDWMTGAKKIQTHVAFPQDELVMTPYLDENGESAKQPVDSHKCGYRLSYRLRIRNEE